MKDHAKILRARAAMKSVRARQRDELLEAAKVLDGLRKLRDAAAVVIEVEERRTRDVDADFRSPHGQLREALRELERLGL